MSRPGTSAAAYRLDDETIASWRAWREAAARAEVDAELRSLYADLDAAVAARGPRCDQSGRCCKFDTYGHRLYVTALEIAWFIRSVRSSESRVPSLQTERGLRIFDSGRGTRDPGQSQDACVYQVDGLCTTHAVRPLGCRVFFCEPGTEEWQHATYERFIDRLRAMHDRLGVEYRYLEWRAGLDEAAAAQKTEQTG